MNSDLIHTTVFSPTRTPCPKADSEILIALPLQKRPREQGNSVFLDELFQPYPDQWRFLESIQRLPIDQLAPNSSRDSSRGESDRSAASICPPKTGVKLHGSGVLPGRERKGTITGLLPPNVRVVVSNLVYIEREGLPSAMVDRLIRIAAFQNPEFYNAQAMRLSTHGKPRVISYCEVFPEHIRPSKRVHGRGNPCLQVTSHQCGSP